jgi:FkbM family methyltransferase
MYCDDVPGLDEPFNLRKQCRHGEMVFNRCDRYVGRSLELYGEFSETEAELFGTFLQPGMLVVEAGSNLGALTLALSGLAGNEGAVIAFEPQRMIFHLLCANLALNSISNVFAYQKAVGSEPGAVMVPQLDPASEANFGGLTLGSWDSGEQVPVVSLDGMRFPRLDLLKADVEGMEEQVLEGAMETIARHRPILYLEDDRPEKSESLHARIRSLRYKIYRHLPPLFNPNNFAGNPENVFPGIVSINLLCVPEESAWELPNLPHLTRSDEIELPFDRDPSETSD